MVGVEKKLIDESRYYVQNDIDVYLLNDKEEEFKNNIAYKNVYNSFSLPSCLAYFYVRLFTYSIIAKVVPIEKYDRIYLRYPLMDFSALSFSRKYGDKLITQHHTKELEEIKAYEINRLFAYLQLTLEKWLAPRFFQRVYGITAMSEDIILYEKNRLGFTGKTHRFSNGINPQNFQMKVPPKCEDVFHLTIVASDYSPWHGLDRLLESLFQYRNQACKIHLHIVGQVSIKEKNLIKNCRRNEAVILTLHGKLFGENLNHIFLQTHMACDSLAMYRLGMNESSTLKSKEYVARGIPFIYSAIDKDMYGLDEYLYDAKNTESHLDFNDIIAHYKKLDVQKMQRAMKVCVNEVLDWKIKINHLTKFLFKGSPTK